MLNWLLLLIANAPTPPRMTVVVDRDMSGATCLNLPNPATCCPVGFTQVGWAWNDTVCLEDVASGMNQILIEENLNGQRCEFLPNPANCCPNGYAAAGYDPNSHLICIGQ